MITYARHHTKLTGFMPWSFDHPPMVTINIRPTEISMIKHDDRLGRLTRRLVTVRIDDRVAGSQRLRITAMSRNIRARPVVLQQFLGLKSALRRGRGEIWKTRPALVPVGESPWGFESLRPHGRRQFR